jgi:Baseplate J-like protein
MTFASTNGLLYTNTTGGTLALSGTLVLQVAALQPGAAWNVGNNTITSIVGGTLPGVTVNNPDPGTGTWITSQGADQESTSAYMLRCQQRWPSLGAVPTQSVFSLWATLAEQAAGHATTITKTLAIQDSAVPGQVDLFLAGASGAVGAQAVADVIAYIQPRIPACQVALVQAATNVVLTVAGTVNFIATKTTSAAIQAAVAAALAAYITSLGIGSDAGGTQTKAFYTELLGAVAEAGAIAGAPVVRNVANFTVNGGSADIGLTLGQVATLTNSLTFSAV